ncbi:MarR family transcriptional regulator [Streptomyces sp. ICBB 8177]|uniref:MarR family winged helix-turn-helix transcriptional regulator n=1 Tax=Streptomyces sp. ICBB 8177 TaxID=563922 RepID=UPI001F543EE2|nr:MarR family transcriptional regulator [Streptomyces sp. ICBB 8177]
MPEPDPSRTAVELATAVAQLSRRMRAAAPHGGLTPSQRIVLGRLAEGDATTAALARAERVRPQSMRLTVAALEEQGLVERRPDPGDGRQVVVSLTAAGARCVASARDAKRGWLTEAIETELTEAQQRTLTEAVALLRRLAQS